MKHLRILLFIAALPAFGQQTVQYVASTGNVAVVAATYAATLQQPATDAVTVAFPTATTGALPPVGATVYCSVACVATISRNCTTAASATAGTVTSNIPNVPAASVTMWTASNASSCTALRVINIAAGQEYPVDLSKFNLATTGTKSNLHISLASLTGTVNITFYPLEQH
jgi:hypothetical protein